MSTELLNMTTDEFLTFINKYPHLGGISVLDHESAEGTHEDLRVGDVCIYYDYCTDDAGRIECDEFCEWVFGYDRAQMMGLIGEFMADQGYKQIDDNDGSGNGLYYGSIQFRKA